MMSGERKGALWLGVGVAVIAVALWLLHGCGQRSHESDAFPVEVTKIDESAGNDSTGYGKSQSSATGKEKKAKRSKGKGRRRVASQEAIRDILSDTIPSDYTPCEE